MGNVGEPNLKWSEWKKQLNEWTQKIEAQGIRDEDEIWFIDIQFLGDKPKIEKHLKGITITN